MSERLKFIDPETARDVLTFAGRAGRIADEGVRLQAERGVMRVSTATLVPQGLLDRTPTVLGMRIVACDPELLCDLVVAADALRGDAKDPLALLLPEAAMLPAWAGVSPPQSGWEKVGTLDAHAVATIAAAGIAEVARAVPEAAGDDVVRQVRAHVWGRPNAQLADAPAGVAFAADALGFLRDAEEVPLFRADRWLRLSARRGHVFSRGPAKTGLTDVRATGS